MISIRHNDNFKEVKGKVDITKLKQSAVAEYNRFMCGIDKADQMTSYYLISCKTMRWQLKVFFSYA